jgi:hypothetical protein
MQVGDDLERKDELLPGAGNRLENTGTTGIDHLHPSSCDSRDHLITCSVIPEQCIAEAPHPPSDIKDWLMNCNARLDASHAHLMHHSPRLRELILAELQE